MPVQISPTTHPYISSIPFVENGHIASRYPTECLRISNAQSSQCS